MNHRIVSQSAIPRRAPSQASLVWNPRINNGVGVKHFSLSHIVRLIGKEFPTGFVHPKNNFPFLNGAVI
jgi:hypothetical protein